MSIELEKTIGGFWKAAVGAAGLAAIGSFVIWSLYSKFLDSGIFTKVDGDQTFSLMQMFLVFVFLFAVFSVGIWFLLKKKH